MKKDIYLRQCKLEIKNGNTTIKTTRWLPENRIKVGGFIYIDYREWEIVSISQIRIKKENS